MTLSIGDRARYVPDFAKMSEEPPYSGSIGVVILIQSGLVWWRPDDYCGWPPEGSAWVVRPSCLERLDVEYEVSWRSGSFA